MRIKTAILGVLGYCLASALPALASEAFTLTIPTRFNAQQETGKVKITFTLNAAPAGAQLLVDGTTVNLGGNANLPSGDTVSFEALPGFQHQRLDGFNNWRTLVANVSGSGMFEAGLLEGACAENLA